MKVCCDELLKLLDEKGFLTEDVEHIQHLICSGNKKEKKKIPPSERQGKYDETKCHARIWAEGYDSIQCQFSPTNGCFCRRHGSCSEGKWWLGNIKDERPERPILYSGSNQDGIEHKWKDSIDEKSKEDLNNTEKNPKRRGRPKGSKNKKKNEEKKMKNEITMEELQSMIDKKQALIDSH